MSKYLDENGLEYFWEKIKNYANDQGIEYIVGTQTAATNAWKGVTKDAALRVGKIIAYYLPVAGNRSAATLNLTLADGSTTGAIALRRTASSTVTTQFAAGNVIIMTYDGTYWKAAAYYDSNTNTIGYQLRTNSTVMTVTDTARYYKLYFTSANGEQWVPASVNSTNNATSARPVNQRPIDPFGRIVYTSANTSYAAGSTLAAATAWDQYAFTLGYSFNRTGAELALTVEKPVYVKCAPQTDGSAVIDADVPCVQDLPSTADGKIYIFLGIAYDATHVELYSNHPVYWHDGTGIRLWTGAKQLTESDVNTLIADALADYENGNTSSY